MVFIFALVSRCGFKNINNRDGKSCLFLLILQHFGSPIDLSVFDPAHIVLGT